jgi:hypothetical protein
VRYKARGFYDCITAVVESHGGVSLVEIAMYLFEAQIKFFLGQLDTYAGTPK